MQFSDESGEQIRKFIPLIGMTIKEQRKGPMSQKPHNDPSQGFRKN
jgi:hypothetical protein